MLLFPVFTHFRTKWFSCLVSLIFISVPFLAQPIKKTILNISNYTILKFNICLMVNNCLWTFYLQKGPISIKNIQYDVELQGFIHRKTIKLNFTQDTPMIFANVRWERNNSKSENFYILSWTSGKFVTFRSLVPNLFGPSEFLNHSCLIQSSKNITYPPTD